MSAAGFTRRRWWDEDPWVGRLMWCNRKAYERLCANFHLYGIGWRY